MPTSSPSTGYRERNSTADRALTILGMFSDGQSTVTAADVAERLGVARSTAYRYVQSLVSERFLEELPRGGYGLGVRILELARVARRSYGLSDIALPVMAELSQRFGQTVLLTRRSGASIICLEREEAAGQAVRVSYERGSTLPINAGASAHVLMAWSGDAEVRRLLERSDLVRFTSGTLTSVDALMEMYAQVRDAGHAVSRSELDPDVLGVAVPIRGDRGQVVAGLSITAVLSRVPDGAEDVFAAGLKEASARIDALVPLGE